MRSYEDYSRSAIPETGFSLNRLIETLATPCESPKHNMLQSFKGFYFSLNSGCISYYFIQSVFYEESLGGI